MEDLEPWKIESDLKIVGIGCESKLDEFFNFLKV